VARQISETTPIVFCSTGDPVADGLVASLAHPGGNTTGLTTSSSELSAKRLQLLRELIPGISSAGIIRYPSFAQGVRAQALTEDAAQQLRLQVHAVEAAEDQYESALASMKRKRVGAVILIPHVNYVRHRKDIAELALKYRVPMMYEYGDFVAAGGLMSYGPNLPDLYRRAGAYVDRIVRGTKPGNLPVEQPTKFELVLNLRTAKVLGLTIPHSVLLRADKVIE
jgi:putative ABC transport system substrate-binding protein